MSATAVPRAKSAGTPLWAWIVLITLGGAVAAGLGALAASKTSAAWADLWSDVAKAGVQVVALGMAGGALTEAWKAVAERREKAAEARDKVRAEFASLIDLYNDVKSIRRALRSLGLDAKLYIDDARSKENEDERYFVKTKGLHELKVAGLAVDLTQRQADGFREQMQRLNEVQLGFEAKYRQFQEADLLGKDRAAVVDTLIAIESFLNHLVRLWEEHGWTIQEGTKLDDVSRGLQPLYRKVLFKPAFSYRLDCLTEIFNEHLFGAPPENGTNHKYPAAPQTDEGIPARGTQDQAGSGPAAGVRP